MGSRTKNIMKKEEKKEVEKEDEAEQKHYI